jgi:deoxyribodipyrimidine photo-lyase
MEAVLKPLPASMELTLPPSWPEGDDLAAKSAHPFSGGETMAQARLKHLIVSGAMSGYKDTRNGLLGLDFSTKLSAYLAIGCVTARQVHAAIMLLEDGEAAAELDHDKTLVEAFESAPGFGKGENEGTQAVRFELLWRDYMRLCARKFGTKLFHLDGFRGSTDRRWEMVGPQSAGDIKHKLDRFLAGRTGIGLIDASQRELIHTGYCSNRARQNVASFLAKHLHVDWRLGAEWYECMLVDYDVASNWGNWQYVAGVGNDPREGRIFNPIKQALDYDPKGKYIKTWIPELRELDLGEQDESPDQEKLMGLFQAWRIDDEEKSRLNLDNLNWVNDPLVKITFSVGRMPRTNNRGRGGYRGRGNYRGRGRARGRGSYGQSPNMG